MPVPVIGVKYIKIHRYDKNGEDIASNIRFTNTIRVNHGNSIRSYKIISAIVDPTNSSSYYLEVKPSSTSTPAGGDDLDVALVPSVEFDLNYHEYNALYSNAIENQKSSTKVVVERNTLGSTADNLDNILAGTEQEAQIQDDLYESTGLSNARFNGSRNTSTDINVYEEGDNAILQQPAVENTQDFFAYFEYIGGTSPEIVNKSAVSVKYLIGSNGTILNTSSDEAAVYLLKHNFESGQEVKIQLDDPDFGGKNMSVLDGVHTVYRGGLSAVPILHNHAAAMPQAYAENPNKYSYFIALESEVSGSTLYLDVSSGTWTANGSNWITGSTALFQDHINNIDLYDTDFRQIGLGVNEHASDPIYNWMQSGELTQDEDYAVISGSTDILYNDPTGYGGISNTYKILPNDRIIFHSEEYPNWRVTYQIYEVVKTATNIYLRVDRNVQSSHIRENKFAIVRYVDNPKSVVINSNKPRGGTSGGILKPKYVSPEAEKSIRATIADMRGKGMI